MAEEALKVEPNNVEAMILLGNAFSGQNEIDKAMPLYEKALSLDPANLKAMLNLAAVQLRKKDVPLAETTFKKALQQHTNDIQAYLAIAAFYAATQRPQETEVLLKKAFDMAPSDSRCLYSLSNYFLSTKRIVEAESIFKEAIARKPEEREPRWGMANFYLQQGKVDTGIEVLNELLKIKKNDRQSLLLLAEIYISRDDDAKAEKSIQTVLAANKNDGNAHFLNGRILRRRREYDKAMTEFDTAIKLDVSLSPSYLEKANLLLIRGDLDACEATLRAALQQNRNYLPARGANAKLLTLRQRPQEALNQAQEVLSVMPNNEDALGARAEAFRISGKLADSRKDWIRLCEIQPKSPDYPYRLGVVEALIGNKTAAIAAYRKALELRPDFSAAINDILYLQIQDKKFEAAFVELDRLSKTSFPQDEINKFRGRVYLAKGDAIAAEAAFNKALQINPRNYQIYIMLAQLNLQRNNLPQAIKEVDKAIAGNDKFSPAFLQKAYYLEQSRDISSAIANYRKALALDSNNAVAANNLAWLLCESSGNLEEALSLSQAARKRLPEEPEIAETLGWTYYKMKNYTLAVDQLLFSVNNRKQPSAENYYRLGMALYAKGDLYHAKQTLQKALVLNTKFPGAEEARRIINLPS
jgi:Tfp pilus assembly protein PilF